MMLCLLIVTYLPFILDQFPGKRLFYVSTNVVVILV
jgi:hypothetical protein